MSRLTAKTEKQLTGALERLSQLHPKKIDLSLGRMQRCLDRLGNPEGKLPPVIHVAGTNGKGSVVAYLRGILEGAGLKCHVYISPHLVSFRERIRLAGKLIEEDHLVDILERVEKANGNDPITYFEVTTAAALLAFSETPADVCLLEVGLGGRLDATNVVDKPLVSVITPVARDHAEFLGTDLKGVAREKAGIMKKGIPVVSSAQTPEVRRVLESEAARVGAPLTFADRDVKLPVLPLCGIHQQKNARTAIAALEAQSVFKISPEVIESGLKSARWPARFQKLDPVLFALSEDCDVWLDGGHNPHAAAALSLILKGMAEDPQPLVLIVGMMANKDAKGFLKPLAGLAKRLVAIPIPGEDNAADPRNIAAAATKLGFDAAAAGSLEEAFRAVEKETPCRVLIAGSLYLAGHVLEAIGWVSE